MTTIATKKIKILTSGPITAIGYIWGPVLTPYHEKMNTIFKLLSAGVKLVEVTDDGREVELTLQNYYNDNNSKPVVNNSKEERKVIKEVKPIEDVKVEEHPTDAKEKGVKVENAVETKKPDVKHRPDLKTRK